MKQLKNAGLAKLRPVSLKQIEKFLQKISLIQNADPPGKDSWAKTRPSGSDNVRILGSPEGDGQAWN